jgi:hypothetical protein
MSKWFSLLCTIPLLLGTGAQAQPPEEGRTLWDHNGSIMYLVANESSREFYYQKPRPGMLEAGAHPDDLLFKGQINDGQISGIAYIFNAQCGQVPFHVKGPALDNGSKIVLTGQAPHVGRNCQTAGEYTSTLEFKLLKTSEVTQPPPAMAQMPNVEEPTPESLPSDAGEGKLSNDPSARPTRTRQTPSIGDPGPRAPSSGVVAPNLPGNSLAAQLPSGQEPRSEAAIPGQTKTASAPSAEYSQATSAPGAQGFMNKERLAPLIIGLNVALPLFSVVSLVMMLKSSA